MHLSPHVVEHVSLDLSGMRAPVRFPIKVDRDDYTGLTVYTSFTHRLPSEVQFDQKFEDPFGCVKVRVPDCCIQQGSYSKVTLSFGFVAPKHR